MKIYFTADAKIDPQYSLLFNQIAIEIRKNFTDVIESISAQHAESITWWVSSPASRNTFASPFFHYCCCLVLLERLLRANVPVDEIVTDSKAFRKIIETYLVRQDVHCKVVLAKKSAKQFLKALVRPIYIMFGLPLRHILFFFIAKRIRFLQKSSLSQALTLIDTFIMPGYLEKDRYYPGLVDCLTEEEKQHIWFVPHLYGFSLWGLPLAIKQLRKSKRNFILKDDFLKFNDYWCLWRYLWPIRKLQIKSAFFNGADMSSLVLEELISFRNIGSSYVSLLNYYFAKRLKEAGIKLKLVIDWFENQSIDKGWNAGFRYFFPDCVTVGYQGFVFSKHFLSLYPTDEERKSAVIPQKIVVMGRELVPAAKEFCSALNVQVAPAFRFQHLWRKRRFSPIANRHTILVALPIIISDAIYMLKLIASISMETADGVELLIKPHPATAKWQIQSAFGDDRIKRFIFVEGDFSDCVEKANLLISVAGTACMEALSKGTPVIVIGNNHGLTQNPIPQTIISDAWSLCYSIKDIEEALQFYRNRDFKKIDEHEKISNKIKEDYFEPVTKEGVKKFLEL